MLRRAYPRMTVMDRRRRLPAGMLVLYVGAVVLPSFAVTFLRRCVLTGSPLALERRFIASPI